MLEEDLLRARFVKDNIKDIVFDLKEYPIEEGDPRPPVALEVKSIQNWCETFFSRKAKKITQNQVYNTVFEFDEYTIPLLKWKFPIFNSRYYSIATQMYYEEKGISFTNLAEKDKKFTKWKRFCVKMLRRLNLPARRRAFLCQYAVLSIPLLKTEEGYKVNEYHIKQFCKFYNFLAKENLIIGQLAPVMAMSLAMFKKDEGRAALLCYNIFNQDRITELTGDSRSSNMDLINKMFGFKYLCIEGTINNDIDWTYIDTAIENYKKYKP